MPDSGENLAVRADEPPFSRHSRVDTEGRFQFADVPAGDYVVQLNAPDGEPGATASTVTSCRTSP